MNFLIDCFWALPLLAQEDAPVGGDAAAAGQENPLVRLVPMVIGMIILFYFVMWRPQQREQKERQERLGSLKKNDRVVTIGGIVGTISTFSDDGSTVTLKIDDNNRIKVTRESIRGPWDPAAESDSGKAS